MSQPTAFPDLNAVLAQFLERTRSILGEHFCGAYLQGSFAVGDADVHSDVDFIVVTHDELGKDHFGTLDAMHGRLYALAVPWAQHLEGSYISEQRLRHVDPLRTPLPYLDNGASALAWDNHCNTAVVRWSLREHGVVLAGPDPKLLVEPVSAAELRAEVRAELPELAVWAHAPTKAGGMSRWKQPYLVLTVCRMLHALATAQIVSKREAAEWAQTALDAEWAGLIESALADRSDPWGRVHQPAEPQAVERTLAFVDYGLTCAG